MRFKSNPVGGYQVFAVSGIDTVSFGITVDPASAKGLLGFAIEREDHQEKQRYFMYGFKVFQEVHPNPGPDTRVLTFDQPMQGLVWDDFTAKPGRRYTYTFHPLKGAPKALDRSTPPVSITLETEPMEGETHDVYFNRGVASSQAYVRKFGNQKPDDMADPALRTEALQWLSRRLDEKLLQFIDQAEAGDSLLCAFYEFRYPPVAERLKAAVDRGVTVRLVLDGKDNGAPAKPGVPARAPFPRDENRKVVAEVGFPAGTVIWREKNADAIAHNKFMVWLKAGQPEAVWTGSTNLSVGGIHGQTNVGHWVRDRPTAVAFKAYWEVLARDLGKTGSGARPEEAARMKELRDAVEAIAVAPTDWTKIQTGITPVFSPRAGSAVLDMYATLLDSAKGQGCVTLAFGISEVFKSRLLDNTPAGPLQFMLLEKEDRPNPKSTKPFKPLGARQNVYAAWGSFLSTPVYQWARETNAMKLQLNQHVSYIHSKFMLHDPLGADPIVVTGSANFSAASTTNNDENMIIVRGDGRTADIYFTEFNRLFFHYYFRSIVERLNGRDKAGTTSGSGDLFLCPDDSWLQKYKPGGFRAKRVAMFAGMQGAKVL
jgi:phosphatidylserine/phosphatidylglycerophosphate/cardiolipin synthase-like enzyme